MNKKVSKTEHWFKGQGPLKHFPEATNDTADRFKVNTGKTQTKDKEINEIL